MITPYQINCICEHSYYRFIENGRIQQESLRAYVIERCKIALIDPQQSKEKLAAENLAINQKIRAHASKVFDKWLEHYRKRTGVHDWRLYNKMLNLK